ncbi:D-2-hydroxyacid dehydrogenase family protein [Heyndrickxia ginsengihumi]|uniref:D-2-hydroxyacid dehydrogenase family protein n=1 Tax=Heyndrickxia ginsengihumi TaxID=363870 RepID=UPI0004729537|nr:D-2-hydroxyacid dehydrogenase family protein [Heyndrickxia ginsengihumi]MCM3023512.1 D-2-hydroxyacid dehydrogenase family protein [Heyndrickxia ginsengihumi]
MKVVILDDWEQFLLHHPKLDMLKQHFDVEIYHDKPTAEVLLQRIMHADVVIPIRERTAFTREMLEQLKNIKLIAQTGSGLAHIDMEAANRLHIPIATTPGGSSSVVELIVGFMIAFSRQLILLHEEIKNNNWKDAVGISLENKTVGIIGLGKIGTGVAEIAKTFHMNVISWGPRLTKERALKQGVTYVSLDKLLQQSHFVVIAVRLVPETRKLLSERHFNIMRKDALLINTARGEILDEDALVFALQQRQIGGAALDVYSSEPLVPEHPLLKLDNVILSPHIGWKTDHIFNQFLTVSIENIISYFHDHKPIRIANPEVLKR